MNTRSKLSYRQTQVLSSRGLLTILLLMMMVFGSGGGTPCRAYTVAGRNGSVASRAFTVAGRNGGAASGFLDALAKDTWTYLGSDWATDHHLPWSWRMEGNDHGAYANTTEMGLYALAWLAAHDLGRDWSPTWEQTEAEVGGFLDQLRAWQTGAQQEQPNGPNAYQNKVFYQWYWVEWDPPVVGADSPGSNNQLVPSVDNAWLAASLMAIQMYAQERGASGLAQKAAAVLADMDFRLWYHADRALFAWGAVHDPQGGASPWYADTYSDENRITNFVARALGQLSEAEFRASLQAMTQASRTYDGITVEKANWDGSYFTYTAPALFLREMGTGYGEKTILPATQAQIRYAQNQGYAAWGFSDCYDAGSDESAPYVQQGSPPALVDTNEARPGLAAPFASALALNTPLAGQAEAQLKALAENFPCSYHAAYGFHDAVMAKRGDPRYGQCSARFSALAQEWIFLSLSNYQKGFVWRYFYRYPGVLETHCEMFGCQGVYLPQVRK